MPAAPVAAATDRLLWCFNGDQSCKPNTDTNYATCNLARVPSQAFVATSDFAGSAAGQAAQKALVAASMDAGNSFMSLAAGVGKTPFVLITKGTVSLSPVTASTSEYLGGDFSKAMGGTAKALLGENFAPVAIAAGGGDSGGGLSTAAIVAIAVVSVLAVAGITVGGVVYYHKRKQNNSYSRYQDAVREIQVREVNSIRRL